MHSEAFSRLYGKLECVSKGWRDLVRSDAFSCYKARNGWSRSWLFAHSNNQWVAYDPDADQWHPLPRDGAIQDGWDHSGFACVCVWSCLLVIGGCYVSSFPREEPVVVTDVVMRFDPFKKEWKMVASMRTPRTRFACAAVSGKVYVAGGCNLTQSSGVSSAEVYHRCISTRFLTPFRNSSVCCSGVMECLCGVSKRSSH